MFDTHIHSTISFDGYESIDAMCAQACKTGIAEICFCEHMEIGHIYPTDWDGKVDWQEYTRQIEAARNQYPQLAIHMGLEAGLSPKNLAESEAYIFSLPLDFVIASQHQADGRDPYSDQSYYTEQGTEKAIGNFLKETLYCLEQFNEFDVIGHLSFASLYAPDPKPLEYADFPEIIDAILRAAIRNGKGMEVNTTGYHIFDAPLVSFSVLKRFRELGGEIVTIGSDAHFSSVVGFKYAEAKSMLREAGFHYVCTFKERKSVFHSL